MGYSNDDLLKSKFDRGESIHGPSHTGAPKDGFYAKPGEGRHVSHPHSIPNQARGMEAQTHTTATLGKPPKMKRAGHEQIPIAAGMLSHHRHSGEFRFGGMEASYDANPANPLSAGPPRGKRLTPPAASPGMRLRRLDALASGAPGTAHAAFGDDDRAALHELGRRVLQDALDHERQPFGPKRGKFAALPEATEENT